MKAENVKVGQRVRLRWATEVTGDSVERDCTVVGVKGSVVKVDAINGWFHCSQLRLLKPKKKKKKKKKQPRAQGHRRWFVNVYDNDTEALHISRESADECHVKGRTEVLELAIVARHPVGKGE